MSKGTPPADPGEPPGRGTLAAAPRDGAEADSESESPGETVAKKAHDEVRVDGASADDDDEEDEDEDEDERALEQEEEDELAKSTSQAVLYEESKHSSAELGTEMEGLAFEVIEEELLKGDGESDSEASRSREWRRRRLHSQRESHSMRTVVSEFAYEDLSPLAKIVYVLCSSRDKVKSRLESERIESKRRHRSWSPLRSLKLRHSSSGEANENSMAAESSAGVGQRITVHEMLRMRYPFYSPSFERDYVGIICTLVVGSALYGADYHFTSSVVLSDPGLQLPLQGDLLWAFVVFMIVPPLALAIVFRRDSELLHALSLAMAASGSMTTVVGLIISGFMSQLRPDFLARCAPWCLQNVTWVYVGTSIAQCGWPDPRFVPPITVACPLANVSVEEACGAVAVAVPLLPTKICAGAVDGFGETYSIAAGYRGGFSISLGVVTAVNIVLAFIVRRRAPDVYGIFAALYAAASSIFLAGASYGRGKHDTFSLAFSLLTGAAITLSVLPLYFHWASGVPRRRPPITLHYVNWWRVDGDDSDSEASYGDLDSRGDLNMFEGDEGSTRSPGSPIDPGLEDEVALGTILGRDEEPRSPTGSDLAPAPQDEEVSGSGSGLTIEIWRGGGTRSHTGSGRSLNATSPLSPHSELELESGLFDHEPRTRANENRYYSLVRERQLDRRRRERQRHELEILASVAPASRMRKTYSNDSAMLSGRARPRGTSMASAISAPTVREDRNAGNLEFARSRSEGLRRLRIRPRAFWEDDYKAKLASDELSSSFLLRNFVGRELRAVQDRRPTIIVIGAAIAVVHFAIMLPYAHSTNAVMWMALTLELALYPLFESFAIHSIIWRSTMYISGWSTLAGLALSVVVWFPSTWWQRELDQDTDSAESWVVYLGGYLGAKVAYLAGHAATSFLLTYQIKFNGCGRPSLVKKVDAVRSIGRFLVIIPLLQLTSMLLLVLLCFYTYQYLELENALLQYLTLILVVALDATTRVWLTALLTKGLVAVLADADEIQAYLFAIRTVKLGFSLVQGFGLGRVPGFANFFLACLANSVMEIGVLCISALRRHHPRAPHLRVQIANKLGLPGWRMFPQKTRLETALMIRTQETAEAIIIGFGPLISQLPLYFANGDIYGEEPLRWYEIVLRSFVLVCVVEVPVDIIKNWMSTRVFGLDTYHVRPRDLDLYAIFYMSLMAVMGYLSFIVGHELYALWEILGEDDD